MKSVKYLIIGAGISGLAFAAEKSDDSYLLVEKGNKPGGLCQSFYEKDFVWDVAGHFFHYHSDETKEYYDELMKDAVQREVKKCAKVFYADKYMDAPFQYNIHQLPQDEFIECMTDLYYADCPDDEQMTFETFVEKKYGNGIAKKFLIPYNEKLYACKMNELERNSMGEFLPKLDFDMLMNFYRGKKGQTYNDTFTYPVHGCEEIISALVKRVGTEKIQLQEEVTRVDVENKIAYTRKDSYKYEYLINTADLVSFSRMIGNPTEEYLNFNKVLVLNMGFDSASIDKEVSWVYYPGDEVFYRVGFYNNIAGTEKLSIYVEIGCKANETIDIEENVQKTLADLKRVRVIDDHKLEAYSAYVINPGYAHITTKGRDYTQKTIDEMKKHDVHMIGRYARWEYSAMDDSIEQAQSLAEII